MKLLMPLVLLALLACHQHTTPKLSAIAHAGGGIEGKSYTNSLQALNFNYERGFILFEIDFSWTTDNQLVCLHDWDRTPKWLLNYHEEKPLSLSQFNTLENEKIKLKPCDLNSLNKWLADHPKAYVVTDIKGRNLEGLALILNTIKNAEHRVIPQFTQPEHYQPVKEMGFKSLIWTLYNYKGTNKSVQTEAIKMDLFAITMPPHRAKQGLAKLLPAEIPTYVHTINKLFEAKDYQNTFGLTSVYTDFLEADLDNQMTD